jgi:uncharacterized protein YfaS (alpha-2-macroglobulin family)
MVERYAMNDDYPWVFSINWDPLLGAGATATITVSPDIVYEETDNYPGYAELIVKAPIPDSVSEANITLTLDNKCYPPATETIQVSLV